MKTITKRDIILAKRDMNIADAVRLVSEEDCMTHISNTEEYWFMAGAVWAMEQMERLNNKNEQR